MMLLDFRSRHLSQFAGHGYATRRVLAAPFVWSAVFLTCCFPLGCKQAAAPLEEKAPPATVKWEGALQGALEEWLELVGTTVTLPDRAARVTAPVEGQVRTVLGGSNGKPVLEGQRVEKGTVLVQLDDTIIRANLAKLEAIQEVLPEEEKQAQYATELAMLEVDRLQKLANSLDNPRPPGGTSLVSSVEREKAAIALKDAQSKLKASQSRRAAGIKEVTALREQLRLYTLAAPIGGRVGRIQVVAGQTLAVGTQVAEIIDLDDQVDVLCFVPAAILGRLKLGQPARAGAVEKDPSAAAEVEAEGEIVYIAEQAEAETGNFAVKVRFSNKEAHLRSNRVLRIRVLSKPSKECLCLPEAAVMEDEEPPTVVIVENVKTEKNADGKEETTGVARRLQVETGVRDRILHQVEIVQLTDTEKDPAKKWQGGIKDALFIVEGGAGLQTGDAVKLEVEGD